MYRITPDNIQTLEPNEIFVFGSNSKGLHYGGAAKLAHQKFGAVMGLEYGIQGQSFAINTMSGLDIIESHIYFFIEFASRHQHLTFLVTEIGCGIAGYTPDKIAPLFKPAIKFKNIYLPKSFWKILKIKNTLKFPILKPLDIRNMATAGGITNSYIIKSGFKSINTHEGTDIDSSFVLTDYSNGKLIITGGYWEYEIKDNNGKLLFKGWWHNNEEFDFTIKQIENNIND